LLALAPAVRPERAPATRAGTTARRVLELPGAIKALPVVVVVILTPFIVVVVVVVGPSFTL